MYSWTGLRFPRGRASNFPPVGRSPWGSRWTRIPGGSCSTYDGLFCRAHAALADAPPCTGRRTGEEPAYVALREKGGMGETILFLWATPVVRALTPPVRRLLCREGGAFRLEQAGACEWLDSPGRMCERQGVKIEAATYRQWPSAPAGSP